MSAEKTLLWKRESGQLKQQINELLVQGASTPEDKLLIIAKLLNLKDNICQQINQAISYQKLVTWADLNIKL